MTSAAAQDVDTTQSLQEAEYWAKALSDSLVSEVSAGGDPPVPQIVHNTRVLLVALCWRAEELSSGGLSLARSSSFLSISVIARALMETAGACWYVQKAVTRAYKGGELEALKSTVKQIAVGSRLPDWELKSRNVLYFVDAFDRIVPGFRLAYDRLSESVHPNWAGGIGLYVTHEDAGLALFSRYRSGSIVEPYAATDLANAIKSFVYCYNEANQALDLLHESLRGR